ncbi:MAG: glycosyl transferase, partial [Caulobacteraceae bacterium]
DRATGWRVRPGDPDAWAEALREALATPAQVRHAMGEAGRERVRRLYSLEAMTGATLDVYSGLLRGTVR